MRREREDADVENGKIGGGVWSTCVCVCVGEGAGWGGGGGLSRGDYIVHQATGRPASAPRIDV